MLPSQGGGHMFRNYLITGATGFLGRAVIAELMKTGAQIHALVLNGDPLKKELPGSVYIEYGDVCDIHSLKAFFEQADHNSCVIHCAGIISIETHPDPKIYAVNVNGTKNVLRCCEQKRVGKFIYVSSVHALPQKRQHEEITEKALFSPELVKGEGCAEFNQSDFMHLNKKGHAQMAEALSILIPEMLR